MVQNFMSKLSNLLACHHDGWPGWRRWPGRWCRAGGRGRGGGGWGRVHRLPNEIVTARRVDVAALCSVDGVGRCPALPGGGVVPLPRSACGLPTAVGEARRSGHVGGILPEHGRDAVGVVLTGWRGRAAYEHLVVAATPGSLPDTTACVRAVRYLLVDTSLTVQWWR